MRLKPEEWTFTHHALSRAVDMALDAQDLLNALAATTRPIPSTRYPGRHLIYTERLILCVSLERHIVYTVLWNTWDHGYRTRFNRDDIQLCRDSN